MSHFVYLHGFNSSHQSAKAAETRAFLASQRLAGCFHAPRLPNTPGEALRYAEQILSDLPGDTLLIGSSLGGFYATVLAEKLGLRAVLINPAVRPFELLPPYLGEQTNPYTGESYQLTEQHIEELRTAYVAHPSAERYWLVLGSSDEVLDWREAACHYPGNRLTVFAGDDHRLARWPECLPGLLAFAGAA